MVSRLMRLGDDVFTISGPDIWDYQDTLKLVAHTIGLGGLGVMCVAFDRLSLQLRLVTEAIHGRDTSNCPDCHAAQVLTELQMGRSDEYSGS